MMDIKRKQNQMEIGLRRGWVIYLLYINLPNPMTFRMLRECLDFYNFPLSTRALSEKIEFLRGLRFVRIFGLGSDDSLTDVQQAKLIQRYCENDDLEDQVCLSITTRGITFQEGHFEEPGLMRVNG